MKSKKVRIENVDIEIIKFNPFKGGIILGQTTELLAPALKDIVKATQSKLSEAEQMEVIVGAIQGLFTRKTPVEVMEFIKEIVATGYIIANKKKILDLDDFESLVGEDGDALYLSIMVVAESIKYNFGKFLGKLMGGPTS